MKKTTVYFRGNRPKVHALPLLGAGLLLTTGLSGCGQSGTSAKNMVPVQSVSMLVGLDLTGNNYYSGVTEAHSVSKVNKDNGKEVKECLVKVGDEVKKGQILFTYDMDALNAALELEQLQNQIQSYTSQIAELERQRNNAAQADKLAYTLEIQAQQLEQKEAQYTLKGKQAELAKKKESLNKKDERAEVSGIIKSINDQGNSGDNEYYYGDTPNNDGSYITIMETGTYRIKGTLNENNAYDVYEGMSMMAICRTDSSKCWKGTITEVHIDSPAEDDSNNNYYDYGNRGESSSKYYFYVELEDSEGLLMGQHVYLVNNFNDYSAENNIVLPASYLVGEGEEMYVWASSSKDTLEQRSVTCGEYLEDLDSYVITDGLSLEDFIAFPDNNLTAGSHVIKYDSTSFNTNTNGDEGEFGDEGDFGEGDFEGDFGEGDFGEGDFEGEFGEGGEISFNEDGEGDFEEDGDSYFEEESEEE